MKIKESKNKRVKKRPDKRKYKDMYIRSLEDTPSFTSARLALENTSHQLGMVLLVCLIDLGSESRELKLISNTKKKRDYAI